MVWGMESTLDFLSHKWMVLKSEVHTRACVSSALLLLAGTTLAGCASGARTTVIGRGAGCSGKFPGWCSESWSKTYDSALREWGFDKFVAGCPDDEGSFYARGATRIAGKYDWYCESRSRYLALPARTGPLTAMGFFLAPRAQDLIGQAQWSSGAFSRSVRFDSGFYPLADGECYVDFADPRVGGGVFRNGLAQEEKMFLQLPELLVVVGERNYNNRPLYLSSGNDGRHRNSDVMVFRNAVRPVPAVPKSVDLTCGRAPKSAWPCANFVAQASADSATVNVVAVNAQDFHDDGYYSATEFSFLERKVLAAFAAADEIGCRGLNSGPLGAGVFSGNLHLTVLLHAAASIAYGMPVKMWGMRESQEVRTVVGWIEEGGSMPVGAVLQKLQQGVSWGHGRGMKDEVLLDRARWDAA